MGSLKVYATVAGFLAVATSMTTARAADLLPPPPMPEPFEAEFGGGWYLRGDVGIGIAEYDRTRVVSFSSAIPTTGFIGRQKEVGDQVFVGAGIGYELNNWVRFDATGEYRTKTKWSFLEQDTNFGPGNFNKTSGHFSTVVGLGNVYFDLGTYYGVTPFIGGGVGVAHHMFEGVTDVGLGGYTGGFGIAAKKDTTNFAWALHAGLGYAVTHNVKLELAYRYLNQGDVNAGTIVCQPASLCGLQTNYKLKELESNDIKLGMRWLLAAGPAPAYEPPPLIRKY